VNVVLSTPSSQYSSAGCLDFYGYSPTLCGFLIGGWIGFAWNDPVDPPTAILRLGEQEVKGIAYVCLHEREDVRKLGIGFILFFRAQEPPSGELTSLDLFSEGHQFHLATTQTTVTFDEKQLFAHAKTFVDLSQRNETRGRLLKLLDQPHYLGVDTTSQLPWPFHFELDKTYFCPPSGILLRGWFLDPFRQVTRMTLRSGVRTASLDPTVWITVARPDVRDAFNQRYGLTDDKLGFIAYAGEVFAQGEPLYLEVEMNTGDIAFRPLTAPESTGLGAIRDVLGAFDLRFNDLARAYENVVGPAIERLNKVRLSSKPKVEAVPFGPRPDQVRCSIIIPLYGRIDFLEYQLAFFSRTLAADHELIYVLDDPGKLRETEALSASAYARFGRPFLLVTLGHNVGFGPANNIGLRYATGEYICYLNSDVFPQNPDWLECMIETAETGLNAGLVGAYLLYEDGTVQHEGCTFEILPEFGGWTFAMHPNKGRRIPVKEECEEKEAVTGACMVLRRDLATDLGGFDEGFVIGDFEDADLCLRVRAKGLSCVLDYRAVLFHLERQSQGDQTQSWRMNLTLYNAWLFQKRWSLRGAR
jgi:GT2 family glycosyltransferase